MFKYDAVVVGAGNAGLTASLKLAQSGKKVLLIEQHNLPGGCATSFRRGRFEFEPSLHELCDYGPDENKGDLRKLFDQSDIKVDWCKVPDCFRVISNWSDGTPMDVTMPSGRQEFIDKMASYAPGSRSSMETFFELADEILCAISYINSAAGKTDAAYMKKEFPNFLRTAAYPAAKVFDALKFSQKVKDIMSIYWSYIGVDMEHIAFMHYAAMVHKYVTRSAYIPKLTSHEISLALLERYRALGGEVWFNCRAEEFLFDGSRCCGVRTTQGEALADYVLSSISPHIVYGRMIPKALVPEREKRLAGARAISGRPLVAYFALNKTAEELGIKDYSIFFPPTADSVKAYKALDSIEGNNYSVLVCYNVANPEFSPPGTCIVSFTTLFNNDAWARIKPEEYVKTKNAYAKKMVDQLREAACIDITDCIEEMSVATPWTFARYLGTPEGSVYGYATADWDSMMARLMMITIDNPIKGLKTIGATGPRGAGYSSNYIGGEMFARIVLKEMNEEGGHK